MNQTWFFAHVNNDGKILAGSKLAASLRVMCMGQADIIAVEVASLLQRLQQRSEASAAKMTFEHLKKVVAAFGEADVESFAASGVRALRCHMVRVNALFVPIVWITLEKTCDAGACCWVRIFFFTRSALSVTGLSTPMELNEGGKRPGRTDPQVVEVTCGEGRVWSWGFMELWGWLN